jgi:hypothetical protein
MTPHNERQLLELKDTDCFDLQMPIKYRINDTDNY